MVRSSWKNGLPSQNRWALKRFETIVFSSFVENSARTLSIRRNALRSGLNRSITESAGGNTIHNIVRSLANTDLRSRRRSEGNCKDEIHHEVAFTGSDKIF